MNAYFILDPKRSFTLPFIPDPYIFVLAGVHRMTTPVLLSNMVRDIKTFTTVEKITPFFFVFVFGLFQIVDN